MNEMFLCFGIFLLLLTHSVYGSSFFRTPVVKQKLSYEVKLEINDETISTPVEISLIERPDRLIVLNATGHDLFGGASYINFDKGVIVSHGIDMEPCTVYHIPRHISFRSLWQHFIEQERSVKRGEMTEILPGVACRYGGRISYTSWLGRDIQGFCSPYLFEMHLTVECRCLTEEEEEVHDDKCDIIFVYSEDEIQMVCVRLWLPYECGD